MLFRTREMDVLLMYAGRRPGGGNTEFLLLEVTSGQAKFTADLGSGMIKSIFNDFFSAALFMTNFTTNIDLFA